MLEAAISLQKRTLVTLSLSSVTCSLPAVKTLQILHWGGHRQVGRGAGHLQVLHLHLGECTPVEINVQRWRIDSFKVEPWSSIGSGPDWQSPRSLHTSPPEKNVGSKVQKIKMRFKRGLTLHFAGIPSPSKPALWRSTCWPGLRIHLLLTNTILTNTLLKNSLWRRTFWPGFR